MDNDKRVGISYVVFDLEEMVICPGSEPSMWRGLEEIEWHESDMGRHGVTITEAEGLERVE